MKEFIRVAQRRPAVAITGTLVAGGLGGLAYSFFQRTSENGAELSLTKEGLRTQIPHDAVASAAGATSGGNISIFSQGTRPKSDANAANAGKDIQVIAQGHPPLQQAVILPGKTNEEARTEPKMKS